MAFTRGANVVTNGLVLCLDAANPKSYPGSGTTWRDLSGNSNTGTLTNGPTFSSANGGSIIFDGNDDLILTSTVTNFKSIGMWLFLTGGGSDWVYILDARTGMANSWITFFSSGGIGSAWTGMHINANQVTVSYTNIPLNTWFYLYVDSASLNTSAITFMNRFSGPGGAIGRLSNIQIYNRTLTQEELQQNYNAQKSRFNL
jgi:hypothetical protein